MPGQKEIIISSQVGAGSGQEAICTAVRSPFVLLGFWCSKKRKPTPPQHLRYEVHEVFDAIRERRRCERNHREESDDDVAADDLDQRIHRLRCEDRHRDDQQLLHHLPDLVVPERVLVGRVQVGRHRVRADFIGPVVRDELLTLRDFRLQGFALRALTVLDRLQLALFSVFLCVYWFCSVACCIFHKYFWSFSRHFFFEKATKTVKYFGAGNFFKYLQFGDSFFLVSRNFAETMRMDESF